MPGRRSQSGSWTTTRHDPTPRSATGRQRSLPNRRRQQVVEKTRAAPAWKTLRVSHFPTASTATKGASLRLYWKTPTRRKSHYPWTKNGGHVIAGHHHIDIIENAPQELALVAPLQGVHDGCGEVRSIFQKKDCQDGDQYQPE